jgi:hypothetical protein
MAPPLIAKSVGRRVARHVLRPRSGAEYATTVRKDSSYRGPLPERRDRWK